MVELRGGWAPGMVTALGRIGGGRVVNVVSIGGLTIDPYNPTYSAWKAPALSVTLAARILPGGPGSAVHCE